MSPLITDLFILQLPEINYLLQTDVTADNSFYSNLSMSTEFTHDSPDLSESCDGVSLTTLGRYQVT